MLRFTTRANNTVIIPMIVPSIEESPSSFGVIEEWCRTHLDITDTKIHKVAIHFFLSAGVLAAAVYFPITCCCISLPLLIGALLIDDHNIEAWHHTRASERTFLHDELLSFHKTMKNSHVLARNAVVFSIVAFSFAVALPIIVAAAIGLSILYVGALSFNIADHNKSIKELRSSILIQEEEKKVWNIYGRNCNPELLKEEKKLRQEKKAFLKHQEQCISQAWHELLKSKKYTLEQGAESDAAIFLPLCQMAVFEELKTDFSLRQEECPPSIKNRMKDYVDLKKTFKHLSETEQETLKEAIINNKPFESINENNKNIFDKLRELAFGMLQEPIFEKPLFNMTVLYALSTFDLIILGGCTADKISKNVREIVPSYLLKIPVPEPTDQSH